MQYISTRNTKQTFTFKNVFLNGLASDGGLYIPKKISEETIMSSAICPPDLSEMHTAHIEIIASDCNVKVFSIITYV